LEIWMNLLTRILGALLAAALFAGVALAQDAAPASERDKVGYLKGLDAGRAIGPGLQDLDEAAFVRGMENAMAGGSPLVPEQEARSVLRTLMASIGARASGKPAVVVDRTKAGLVVGGNMGQTLANLRGEFDMPMFLRGLHDGANARITPALSAVEIERVRTALAARVQAAGVTARATEHATALERERVFLEGNRTQQGVFVTPSGLQYKVLQQGNGIRPRPGQQVRVNYLGALLDGTKFDSSYDRGQPALFSLGDLIPGWTEGLGLMPVGAKYRFWIPSRLGYGETGSPPAIPRDATLVFDVELLGVE